MRIATVAFLALALSALILAACVTPSPTPTPQPLPPQVIARTPARGEELRIDAPIVITFDQPMDRASVEEAFSISPSVEGSFSWRDNSFLFTPRKPFRRGESYLVRISKKARSAKGVPLAMPVEFRFSTVGYLEVAEVQPAPGAQDVAADALVAVVFNRPVVPLTAIEGQEELPQPLLFEPPVEGEGQWLNTSIYTFRPVPSFAAATTYTVTVKAGLEDTTGGVLAEDFVWSFTVHPPVLVKNWPRGGKIKPTEVISATFSQPMDRASVEERFSLTDEEGREVPGSFRWEGDTTVVFVPEEPLDFETTYQATIEAGARAKEGGGTERAFSWRFTTVNLPRIVRTRPADGEKWADPYGGITVRFSCPIDLATLADQISITPQPTYVYTYWSSYDDSLYVDFDILPSTDYTVTLGAEIGDPYGNTLGQEYTFHFTTRELNPMAYIQIPPGDVGFYGVYTDTVVYVAYRNVSRLDFGLYRMKPEEYFRWVSDWRYRERFAPAKEDLVRRWSLEADAPLNQARTMKVEVAEEGGALPPGLYLLELTAPECRRLPYWRPSRQIMVVSGLNLMLKHSKADALVWATDLESGQPVPDLPLAFYDANGLLVARGQTDTAGVLHVQFPPLDDPWRPFFVISEGEDFALASNLWDRGISAWEFDIGLQMSPQPFRGYFYTDRPIYRPGQKVYFKGLIRADDDAHYSLPPAGRPITVTISDARGKEVYQQVLHLSEMGSVHGEMVLDEEASLGYYNLTASLDGVTFASGFRVAEYRKPEFEVTVEADRDEYIQGDDINVSVKAAYYFGGPVAGAQVRWTVLSQDYFFHYECPAGETCPWYDFTDYEWGERRRYGPYGQAIAEGEGVTDEEGRFAFRVPADISEKRLSQLFTIDVAVTDINGQEVANRTSVVVHKGAFYIGLAPRRWCIPVGEEGAVDLIAVTPQSEPVPGVPITVTVYHRRWYSVQEKGADGRYYWTSKVEDTPVLTTTLTTDDEGKAVLVFTPDKGGAYKVLAVGTDERGNEVRSSTYLWVSGRKGEYIPWRMEPHNRIELIPDKKEYTPGEVAKILVPSPYQGPVRALLTVERGSIINHRVITLTSNSELVEVPILSDYAPNVYISLTIVKGRDETSPVPSFRMGYVAIPVSIEEKELTISIASDKDKYGPREEVAYTIRATDHRGKGVRAELSLALVDKSVLALAEEGPGIVDCFWRERDLGVRTGMAMVLLVEQLAREVRVGAKGGGGGAEVGPLLVRRKFPDTAYWNPVVLTDEDGRARISIHLPDTLTTWRLTAKAATADTLVGEGRAEVVTTKDLLLRPVAPRFFVIGDKATISAVVHNNTDDDLEVEVSLQSEGLDISGPSTLRVKVPAWGKAKADWDVKVKPVEEAVLLFTARAGSLSDAVEISLPVYHYSTPEVVATAGTLDEAGQRLEAIVLPPVLDTSQGELTVQLEASLAAGMQDGLKYLEHYPYECAEQAMSRFLPNVLTYRALKKLGIEKEELEAKLAQLVGVGLQRLYAQQKADGGWGWWVEDKSNPYLTAYILLGMVETKRAGFLVDENVMKRAAGFLKRHLKPPSELKEPYQYNGQAFILYVLAEYGEGDLGRCVALYRERQFLGHYGKAFLAMALGLLEPEERTRVDTLISDLVSSAVLSATGAHWEEEEVDHWTMNTDTRSTAIALAALARLQPDNALAPQVVRWLMMARKEGHWETTQETAWALIALTDWMMVTGELEGDYSWEVTINGAELGKGRFSRENITESQKLQIAIGELLREEANRLLIRRLRPTGDQTGKGRLYYAAYLRYFLPVEEVKALSRGIIVSRRYSLADEPEKPLSQARVGDVIQVKLTIIAPHDLYYLVVEDPIPAGTEALETSLRTVSAAYEKPELRREGEERWGWGWWRFNHTEMRDEKVVLFASHLPRGTYEYTYLIRAGIPGQFLVMPTYAYQMYFPEVFGRGEGMSFAIAQGD